jgi:hypothetical protein
MPIHIFSLWCIRCAKLIDIMTRFVDDITILTLTVYSMKFSGASSTSNLKQNKLC